MKSVFSIPSEKGSVSAKQKYPQKIKNNPKRKLMGKKFAQKELLLV